eukprot:TRINITY_DN3069_c0_g5_i1.p1 TRINITY_DN3069_c0_g5~~TRINITY_DN3069_c0_g5_i1.p1  ORF type:complete len:198 (-),score=25.01 TRINITY_DN3069_c0_g5_i1:18-611(-)
MKGQVKGVQWVIKMNKCLKSRGLEEFNLNIKAGKERSTLLHLAIHCFDIVAILIQLKANVFAKNKEGKTPRRTIRGDCVMTKVFRKLEKAKIMEIMESKEVPDHTHAQTPITKSTRKDTQENASDDIFLDTKSNRRISENTLRLQDKRIVKVNHPKFIHTTRVSKHVNIYYLRDLSLIHICRCRRYAVCRSRWSPYH